MDHDPIIWEAFEYEPRKRSNDWYWALGIIAIAIAAVSLFFGDLLFAVFILIGAATIALYARRPPKVITYELDNVGLVIEKNLYPYTILESFWIEDDSFHNPKLLFKSRKVFMPFIIVHLHDDLQKDIMRAYLRQFLDEVHHDEPLSHKVFDYLGF